MNLIKSGRKPIHIRLVCNILLSYTPISELRLIIHRRGRETRPQTPQAGSWATEQQGTQQSQEEGQSSGILHWIVQLWLRLCSSNATWILWPASSFFQVLSYCRVILVKLTSFFIRRFSPYQDILRSLVRSVLCKE